MREERRHMEHQPQAQGDVDGVKDVVKDVVKEEVEEEVAIAAVEGVKVLEGPAARVVLSEHINILAESLSQSYPPY